MEKIPQRNMAVIVISIIAGLALVAFMLYTKNGGFGNTEIGVFIATTVLVLVVAVVTIRVVSGRR